MVSNFWSMKKKEKKNIMRRVNTGVIRLNLLWKNKLNKINNTNIFSSMYFRDSWKILATGKTSQI